ncbi:MAG: hypothetical protein COA79_08360 [Planctomycetota bacterium]|nr:MAG: hypothetical protein COA79_08360 [Planctomycetota bacterium]
MTEEDANHDIQWMLEVKAGNKESFRKIVEKYQQSLLNFFHFMHANSQEAEDLTQDTFLKVYLYREKYSPKAKFNTFLFRIARNTGIDYIRKKKAVPTDFEDDLLEDNKETHDFEEENEKKRELKKVVSELPEKLKNVVVMSYYQERKYQEIADILEIPLGTVKSRMNYAMKLIKEKIDRKKSDE